MRARLVLSSRAAARALVVSLALGSFGIAGVIQACSSGVDSGPSDAGVEAEAAAAAVVDAGCDLSSNLLDQIPDAEIADGASTSGACVACLNAKCAASVGQCNQLCACKNAAAAGLQCYLKNPQNPTACAVAFTGGGIDLKIQTIGFSLIGCVNTNCKEPCATASFEKEAGTTPPDASE